jgi:hypothetical protein
LKLCPTLDGGEGVIRCEDNFQVRQKLPGKKRDDVHAIPSFDS